MATMVCAPGMLGAQRLIAADTARPAYQSLRYREDWSRHYYGDPFDPLKHIDLFGDSWISFGGSARYRGEQEAIDPVAGHIPGAISAPFSDNLAAGRFKSPEQLRARFAALGVDPAQEIVSYCGSGVTATHNILALKLAGFPEPALYPGSWSEWITDPARPVAKT